LIILLEQDGKIIDQVIHQQTKKVSDIFISSIQTLLVKNQLTLQQIEKLYLLIGPGSYTGVRLGLLFARTLKTIDQHFQVYVMNSLKFQAGLAKIISVLDARGGKYFVGIYDKTKPLIEEHVVNDDELESLIAEFELPVISDYYGLDFVNNFLVLKPNFALIDDYQNLVPMYLKKSI
jgi:tRNA threonylcarbamoyl adenosine modification protein YeaZ